MMLPSGSISGRVLVIAGSDSGGGAGIQADIKTISALGGYAATAITAVTAQNTQGVFGVQMMPPDFVRQQMDLVLQDIGADALKTGMLGQAEIIEAVADSLAAHAPKVPLVVDPVMVAKGGSSLLADNAVTALKQRLLGRADLLTPNLPEAEVLLGYPIADVESMRRAARDLLALGPQAVLLKGGHLPGDALVDVLVWRDGSQEYGGTRIASRSTHGTGCTLASAIACGLAQGLSLRDAVARGRIYVQRAIALAPGLGTGHGPLNHLHTIAPMVVD